MRDGVNLHAVVYRPKGAAGPWPAILTITPYLTDSFHQAGVYFASNGFMFASIDCRGRGNSEGTFTSYEMDGQDGHDAVEWLARHPYCNGRVAMGGGSYSGRNQWATMMHAPPHLGTIMPRCASYPGLDFPIRNNIGEQYSLQWLLFTAGRGLQGNLFGDHAYWSTLWRDRFVQGQSYASLAEEHPQATGQLLKWMRHPEPDDYWDAFAPKAEHYAAFDRPVLSVTGYFDDDQHGALAYYRAAETFGSPGLRESNFLVMGPWDHAGIGAPAQILDGVDFGVESVIDMRALGLDWYRWIMADGERPALLKNRVAYYVPGANRWKFATSLDAITVRHAPMTLTSSGDQPRWSRPGRLALDPTHEAGQDRYVYDPSVVDTADLETEILPYNLSDVRLLEVSDGRQLVYDSQPFEQGIEVSGVFRLHAWIGIDQPDTDFRVLIYAVGIDGKCVLLTNDTQRARYRTSLREPRLIEDSEPKLYRFDTFWFTSRWMAAGERLRLVIGPFNSIYTQKNHNSGKPVAVETRQDSRTVKVTVATGGEKGSILFVPIGG
jgi:putative CocE/NonD family hydrolase